ncbi:hypothetical protein QFZ52_000199 [Arthrobacter woluwensis]|uniref:CG0192-related protein n=1 Tax=Arthrobacter woluwensis TaxID=156980 RepID=UPI00277FE633|nr:hypothetical protein [Arthrobacter woluwensis]MDQ0707547.1 hypothetical protein [Arthrobacter woluwensis]
MAVIHRATLKPSKLELLAPWLDRQPWSGNGGELERIGSYRFDDPAGEVGIEGFLLRRGSDVLHVVLTYRGAPLNGADDRLIGTMEHSVLGTRWVYDGLGDPVSQEVLRRALRGEQEQALLELHDDAGTVVQRPEPDVRVRVVVADAAAGAAAGGTPADVTPADAGDEDGFDAVGTDGERFLVARRPSVPGVGSAPGVAPGQGGSRLVATWANGEAVIAAQG